MTRVKRGVMAHKRRKKVIKQAKGYKWGRSTKYKLAKDAVKHALTYAYRDRKTKKRDFRRLWQIKINAAARASDMTYSRFMNALKNANIEINRKMLAYFAEKEPRIFKKIIEKVK
ncbi:MAG: 50S ribosomal protein L20 [Candidatus Portnoybacteria bacterium]|nr:50S ribosomal protein L20 [Candidatus Portnoybacteria bacterium]